MGSGMDTDRVWEGRLLRLPEATRLWLRLQGLEGPWPLASVLSSHGLVWECRL